MKWPLAFWLVLLSFQIAANDLVIQTNRQEETNDIAVSDDGRFVATLGHHGQVSIWDARTGQLLDACRNGLSMTTRLGFSVDGRFIHCSTDTAGTVRDWLHRRTVYSTPVDEREIEIAVDSTRNRLFLVKQNQLWIRALDTGAELGRANLGEAEKIKISDIDVAASGELLLFCRKTGILRFDPKSMALVSRLDLGYPVVPLFDEATRRKMSKLPVLTKVDGIPNWIMDHGRERILVTLHGESQQWVKTVGTSQDTVSPPIPLKVSDREITWLGETGKFVVASLDRKSVEWIDPADPGARRKLPLALPRMGVITRIDCDRQGRTLVIASDQGWFCFEGDPADHTSWKARGYPATPVMRPATDLHPDGKRLLYGSTSGAVLGVTLERGLPATLYGRLDQEVRQVKAFRDGTLTVATEKDYFLLRDGEAGGLGKVQVTPESYRCGDFLLLDAPQPTAMTPTFHSLRSDSSKVDSFSTKLSRPNIHQTRPVLVNCYSDPGHPNRFEISELGNDGKRKVLHTLELAPELGGEPIPGDRDSFLLLDWQGVLHRIDARTGKATRIRETNRDFPAAGHLSPGGDYLVALETSLFPSPPAWIPMNPRIPCRRLDSSDPLYDFRAARFIGFTPAGKGFWLSTFTNEACLMDGSSGKMVATVYLFDDGAAILLLADGRLALNTEATGRVSTRRPGETSLSPAASSPEVFDVLAPYLNPR